MKKLTEMSCQELRAVAHEAEPELREKIRVILMNRDLATRTAVGPTRGYGEYLRAFPSLFTTGK